MLKYNNIINTLPSDLITNAFYLQCNYIFSRFYHYLKALCPTMNQFSCLNAYTAIFINSSFAQVKTLTITLVFTSLQSEFYMTKTVIYWWHYNVTITPFCLQSNWTEPTLNFENQNRNRSENHTDTYWSTPLTKLPPQTPIFHWAQAQPTRNRDRSHC